jgi:type I restriction enzyme, R subunit
LIAQSCLQLLKLTTGRTFTDGQRDWLGRIREHLVANLTIGKEDFDVAPVLADAGGWGKANRVFDGRLAELLLQATEAVAA